MSERCKVCSGKTVEIKYDNIKSNYHRCEVCAFISKDPACYVSHEEAFVIYDRHENQIGDPLYEAYFIDFIETWISNFKAQSREALDFGSGPVPVLAHILKHKYAFEVDIYDKYYAPEKVFKGKQYDLITLTEVLEHLPDPMWYFELFRSLLKPGGMIAVMTQFHHRDDAAFKHWHYRRDESHVSFFTPETMTHIAEQFNLRIAYMDTHKIVVFQRID